ncbi:YbaB/EbfC family nucleoid-associated protein [Mycobacteroides chelonae]|uniref:YbaB/EbfC family nucleoid-associated protein n=1 Tax=Mycobacteroides chelonae TaxID=1774 RepID=UPI0012FFB753|nr:YbaB/EbfC family nucleoid-associated protein [Mycobacteroides chelonae]
MSDELSKIDFTEILAQAQEQIAEITAIQKKQAALVTTSTAAEGMVSVSVNARGVIIETKIDRDYLDEFDLEDLGHHITQAAQAAANEVQSKAAALMGPATERRKAFPSLSEIVAGAPDIRDFVAQTPKPSLAPPNSPQRLSLEGDPSDHGQSDDEPWLGIRA